jgi:hypothetical protein
MFSTAQCVLTLGSRNFIDDSNTVAPWRFWCSGFSMVTQGLQYFPWSFWFLHGAYMLLFFHDASCVSVASWLFLFLHFLYMALQVARPCFWYTSSFYIVLSVFQLLRSASRAPVAPWNF